MKKRQALLSLLVTLASPCVAQASTSPSLCHADEKVLFSCQLKHSAKTVSLCASPDLTKTTGYLQYRAGKTGHVELEFPQSRVKTQDHFLYAHYFRAQDDHTTLSFENNGYSYALFYDYNHEDPSETIDETGIRIQSPGASDGGDSSHDCAKPVVFNLSDLENVLACENPQGLDCPSQGQ